MPTKDMENIMAIIVVLGWANLPEEFPFPAATEQNDHSQERSKEQALLLVTTL